MRVSGGGAGVISQAGGVSLVEIVRKSGLDTAISEALTPWRKPRAVHDPGKILLDVALAVALGGDCLADTGLLRAELGVLGPVASDPTVSRLVDTLAAAGPVRHRPSGRRGPMPASGYGSWPGRRPRMRTVR